MALIAIAALLSGIALSRRFKVLVLCPAIVIAWLMTAAVTIALGLGTLDIVVLCVVEAVGLQLGYLIGAFFVAIERRLRNRVGWSVLSGKSVAGPISACPGKAGTGFREGPASV